MKKIKKGDKVVITCTDSRCGFKPSTATVVSSGSKWITVRLDRENFDFPWWFNAKTCFDDGSLVGGEKDGSYQIYRMYPYETIEEYEYACRLNDRKNDLISDIVKELTSNIQICDIPIEVLTRIKYQIEELKKNIQ